MKRLLTELDILKFAKTGKKVLFVEKNTLITPMAIDKAKILGIVVEYGTPPANTVDQGARPPLQFLKLAIGSDHTGYKTKLEILPFLAEAGVICVDVGCNSEASCNYPDFAIAVAQKVIKRDVDAGIVFDATGIPSCITANKIKGIRATTCYNEFSALSARSHNNSNIITLGAKALGIETIKSILKVWLRTPFEGGRHQTRLDKISALER